MTSAPSLRRGFRTRSKCHWPTSSPRSETGDLIRSLHASPVLRSSWVRDPARTEHAARQRYTRILQRSLSCLTKSVWYFGTNDEGKSALAVSSDPITLRRNGDRPRLYLSAGQLFEIIPDPREEFAGEFKSQTLAYIYSLRTTAAAEDELVAWHWHPLTTPERPGPHVHVRVDHPALGHPLPELHIPSGRVSFEDIVVFLVDDLDVRAARNDWREIVNESQERFRRFRTWA